MNNLGYTFTTKFMYPASFIAGVVSTFISSDYKEHNNVLLNYKKTVVELEECQKSLNECQNSLKECKYMNANNKKIIYHDKKDYVASLGKIIS